MAEPRPAQAPAASPALLSAVARLRRILMIATGALIAAQSLWALVGPVARPAASLAVAALATAAMLSSIWLILGRMVRSGPAVMTGWVGGGYIARIAILVVALLGGRALGLDVRMIGVGLIAAILVGMLAETIVLSRARLLAVEPGAGER